MAGKDSFAIACIGARLLKARRSIKSKFIGFTVAYDLTEEAAERQKAKYMAVLSSTLASVPTRKYVFVLADTNARTGKTDEGGGEAECKVLGA